MRCSALIIRLSLPGYGIKPQLCIHVLVNCQRAYIITFTIKVHVHGTITVHASVRVIDIRYCSLDFIFGLMISCFAILKVVIVAGWADIILSE